jgi:hypothetical protein
MGTLNPVERTLKELQIPYQMKNYGVKVYTCILNKKLVEVSTTGNGVYVNYVINKNEPIIFETLEAFRVWVTDGTL